MAFIVCFIVAGFCKYDAINFSFGKSADPKYYFYVSLANDIDDSRYVKNGNGGIICLEKNEIDLINEYDITKLYGTSISFTGNDEDVKNLLNAYDVKIIKKENFDGLETFYGYSKMLAKGVNLYGTEVNIQIAKRDNAINVGFPILLGSY